jgi:hypothetical protein
MVLAVRLKSKRNVQSNEAVAHTIAQPSLGGTDVQSAHRTTSSLVLQGRSGVLCYKDAPSSEPFFLLKSIDE